MGMVLLGCAAVAAWFFRSALDDSGLLPADEPEVQQEAPATPGERPAKPATPVEEDDRFEFYEMLPDAEVEVPEQAPSRGPAAPAPVSMPGTYVIQAGAFPDFAEADKLKARLALLGISSEIQTAEVNGTTFHRVRIGPLEKLDELNRLRARLRQNGIDSVVNTVGE
jgi:cell division protein FtsN